MTLAQTLLENARAELELAILSGNEERELELRRANTELQEKEGRDWIEINQISDLPNFQEYGFHTGKKVEVRRDDGSEEVTIYQGYGLFGNGLSMFNTATHWRPAR